MGSLGTAQIAVPRLGILGARTTSGDILGLDINNKGTSTPIFWPSLCPLPF